MTTKKGNGVDKARLQFRGYVPSLLIDKEAYERAIELFGEPEDVVSKLGQLIADGLTVKLTPSKNGERVYVDVGGTEIASSNSKGRYLSSYGPSLSSALVSYFCYFIMFEEYWFETESQEYG